MAIDYKIIGSRIQETRKKQKMTRETLAEQLEVSVGYISQIERGITKPNLEMLSEIGLRLHCDLAYLLSGCVRECHDYLKEEWLTAYTALTDKERRVAIALMTALTENR